MGSTNFGQQLRLTQYKSGVDSNNVNDRLLNLLPRGIYSGIYLTKLSDTSVSISAGEVEIGDTAHQVRVQTTVAQTLTVGTTTPFVVLRWTYVASTTNYMDMLAVSAPSANDLVIGKCIYAGSTLTSFDYSLRSNPIVLVKNLLVEPTETASMYVRVRAGKISFGTNTVDVIDQISPVFTAPLANSRIDVVSCDSTGVISIIQGAQSATPVAPDYASKIALAEITLTSASTSITASMIRVVSNAARFSGNAMLLTGDQTAQGVKTFAGGLVIENRTTDPTSPVSGQIWLRTNV